jgi:hypothetical protein
MPDPFTIKATARRLKVNAVLPAEAIAGVQIPENGSPRTVLSIAIEGRTYKADVATTGVRKAVRVISEAGVDNAVLVLQGALAGGDGFTVVEAGLTAQVKAKAAEPQAAPETQAA